MPFVVSLTGFRPAPRADTVLWTTALIEESVNPTATPPVWTQIDSQALTAYADPTNPPIFNFTTVHATAALGLYYRVIFQDASLAQGAPSAAVFNGGLSEAVPSAAEIRAEWPQAPWAEYGYPDPTLGQFDPLEMLVTEGIVEFLGMTGVDPTSAAMSTDKRLPIIRKALKMLVGFNAGGLQPEILDTAIDFDLLSSFNAGGYSESRRGHRGALGSENVILHPWPALNKLLGFIIYFDSQGRRGTEGPALSGRGLRPYPGTSIMWHSRVQSGWDPTTLYSNLPALGARRAWTVSSSG